MRESGIGPRLPSGELVNILLFADNIIILGTSTSDLDVLKSILENWCKDFKMMISPSKTKLITPSMDLACFITDLLSGDSDCLGLVSNYKYLGVVQHRSPITSSRAKGKSTVAKAQTFKKLILRSSFQFVDRIKAASTIWNNVAIPTSLYGADVVPISVTHIKELDVVQNQLGKSLLGLQQSTGNPVVAVELGWKPFQLRVSQVKLSYFKRVGDPSFKGSPLVGPCMRWNISFGQTLYMNNLKSTLSPYIDEDDFKTLSIKDLCAFHEDETLSRIQLLPSLRLLPIP